MPDIPAPGKSHSNKIHSFPWNSQSPKTSLSRSDILLGKTPTAFGSEQSLGICVDGVHPPNNPKRWPKKGRCLRVPKCVILSSLPFWTLYWKSCYLYGPRDIIGQMFTPPQLFGNYYYFEQWNDVDPLDSATDDGQYDPFDPRILQSSFWDNFDPPVSEADKILYTSNYEALTGQQPAPSFDSVGDPLVPPAPRYSRIVGRISQNMYYLYHQQLLNAFLLVKSQLESDPDDPIYVTIPGWFPPILRQTRNGYLTKSQGVRRTDRGSSCNILDAIPCYNDQTLRWGPAYPNKQDPRNSMDFTGDSVPWLSSVDPGFGTNTLHMYVGHPCVAYNQASTFFDYQAWPLTPEGQFIGPIFLGTYIGGADALPFFKGRRSLWRDAGFDYGFIGPNGAAGVYNNYAGIISAASNALKSNFWKHRQFGTRIFTYPASNTVEWDLPAIWKDQLVECPATRFYFGLTFDELQARDSTEDQWFKDCSPELKILVADALHNFPDSPSLREALSVFYPPIQRRVDAYYRGIEPGSASVFKMAIDKNGLADYNVKYEGSSASILDPDAIVAYVREYFSSNR